MTESFDHRQHRFPENRYFENLAVGERFYIPSRTMTEAHFAAFQPLSADNHPIHYDVEYCRERGRPAPLANRLQILCFTAAGASAFALAIGGALIAFIEQSSKFLKPVQLMMTRRALLAILTLAVTGLPRISAGAELQKFPTSELTIVAATGPHRFKVEVAETPAQMEQGLMFRTSLAPDAGMLFIYNQPTVATMWMRNTLIPLDMLFIDAQGRIVNIHQRAVPQSLDIIAAAAPVRAVIELNGGTAARLGIQPGDQVLYPIFGNAS
jgi:uncharacterized membrane protein (UPF0127 family)/acyl dehydratase